MGNWAIVVRGVGAHHGTGNEHDANRMAANFVRALRDAGHSVTSASITFGGDDNLSQPERYLDDRNAIEGLERRARCTHQIGGKPCALVVDHEGGHEPVVEWRPTTISGDPISVSGDIGGQRPMWAPGPV